MKTTPIIPLLKKAYASELQTVQNYLAYLVWLDSLHAQQVFDAVAKDVADELEHAKRLAQRLVELGVPPSGSQAVPRNLEALQMADDPGSLRRVVAGALTTESDAIATYQEIIATSRGTDPVTADLAARILADEKAHRGRFTGLLRDMNKALAA